MIQIGKWQFPQIPFYDDKLLEAKKQQKIFFS